MINWIKQNTRSIFVSNETGKIKRNLLGSFLVKFLSTVLSFSVTLILTRFVGARVYGGYVYIIGLLQLLLIPSLFGFERLTVRQVAVYSAREKWGDLRGYLLFANFFVGMVATMLAGLIFLLSPFFTPLVEQGLSSVFKFSLLALPIMAIARVRLASLQGLHKVWLGQMPDMVIQPLIFVILIFIGMLLFSIDLNINLIMSFYVATVAVSLGIGVYFLAKALPVQLASTRPTHNYWEWLRSAAPFVLLSGVAILNIQITVVMLGTIGNVQDAGLFAAANKWASFIPFAMFATGPALSPSIAGASAKGDIQRLQGVITKTARFVFGFALITTIIIISYRDSLLGLFGDDFQGVDVPLTILCLGQFINASTGSVLGMLTMTGNEQIVVISYGVGVIINFALCFFLIPIFGVVGAAIANALSMIISNMVMAIYVFKKLGIDPTALGLIRI